MPTPFEISERYTEAWADLAPSTATTAGIAGRHHLNTDLSPDGYAARNDLNRRTLAELRAAPVSDETDEFAVTVLAGNLEESIALYEAGKWTRDLNHIFSPFQRVRDAFDVTPKETSEDWEAIVSRLSGFTRSLEGYQRSLAIGVGEGDTVAGRQVESVISQAEAAGSASSRFVALVDHARSAGVDPDRVEAAAEKARQGCNDLADWLRDNYLPVATSRDAVGAERYQEGTNRFLGMSIDLDETYEWGWSEVHRIRSEMTQASDEIDDSLSLGEVIHLLDNDPERSAATRQDFAEFISAIQHQAVDQLARTHFDVPAEIREVSVNIAPSGGSLGAWYVGPSEDFKRTGSIWYAPGERSRLPYWQEVSTAYHEGFPGHHLQVGTVTLQREKLSRFHRTVIWYSGAGEGWALYAERLMDELGYFENPEYRLGLLASQLFRSVRVVLDIGCHLGKTIPEHGPIHAGEVWNYDIGVDYMTEVGLQPRDMSESEVTRYLGWPAQAISYKVGEREILSMREQVMAIEGPDFDRKRFHRKLLGAGAIRLDDLWKEVV